MPSHFSQSVWRRSSPHRKNCCQIPRSIPPLLCKPPASAAEDTQTDRDTAPVSPGRADTYPKAAPAGAGRQKRCQLPVYIAKSTANSISQITTPAFITQRRTGISFAPFDQTFAASHSRTARKRRAAAQVLLGRTAAQPHTQPNRFRYNPAWTHMRDKDRASAAPVFKNASR